MYLPAGFGVALLLTIFSTVCWGSWANTFKSMGRYPFSLFYWDYVLGMILCSLVFAFTLGSHGQQGEPFLVNLGASSVTTLLYALAGGIIFNIANILLVAAIDIAGMTVAFPLAIGIAIIEGVLLSYMLQPKGSALFLTIGTAFAVLAVIFNARAYQALQKGRKEASAGRGIAISVISGVLMGIFAPLVTQAMTAAHPLTPYATSVLFAVGALLSSLVVNSYLMKRPLSGAPASFGQYFGTSGRNHLLGLFGGIVWQVGGSLNLVAAGYLGVPISYAIGQAAPLIAAAWGVVVWREFAAAPTRAWSSLALMGVCYVIAIALIALAYGN